MDWLSSVSGSCSWCGWCGWLAAGSSSQLRNPPREDENTLATFGVVFWVVFILIYIISQTFKSFYFHFFVFFVFLCFFVFCPGNQEGKGPYIMFTGVVFVVGVRGGGAVLLFFCFIVYSYFLFCCPVYVCARCTFRVLNGCIWERKGAF